MSASPRVPSTTPVLQPRTERRHNPRRTIIDQQIVALSLAGDNGGLVLDLSETGLGIQAVAGLQGGASTEVRFALPGSTTRIRAQGEVRWAEPSGRAGIHLGTFQEGSSELIKGWLAQPPSTLPAGESPAPEFAEIESEIAERKLDLEGALQLIAERTLRAAGATGTAIAIGTRAEMICRASAGAAPGLGVRLQADSGLSGEAVRSGRAVLCDDTDADPRVDGAVCRALDLRSAVLVPIYGGEELRGVLEVFSNRPHTFAPAHVRRLRQTSELINAVLTRFPIPGAATTAAALPEAVALPAGAAAEALPAPAPSQTPRAPTPARQPQTTVVKAVESRPLAPPAVEPPKSTETVRPAAEVAGDRAEAATAPVFCAARAEPLYRRLSSNVPLLISAGVVLAVLGGGWAVARRRSATPAAPAPPVSAVASVPAAMVTQPALLPVEPKAEEEVAIAAAPAARKSKPLTVDVPQFAIRQPKQGVEREEPGALPRLVHDAAVLPNLASPRAAVPQAPVELNVSQGVVPGRLISRVDPVYPDVARRTLGHSVVLLNAVVREDGTIGTIQVMKGNTMLARAAVEAVRQWRYEPYRLNGTPVAVTVPIRLTFNPGR